MAISTKTIVELREKTGCGMMDCKVALTEADGDIAKAEEALRKKGLAKAASKASRTAAQGCVDSYISRDGKVGVLVEVNCETDFVARNIEFQAFVKDVALQISQSDVKDADVDSLMALPFVNDKSKTLRDLLSELTIKIGENMLVRRFVRVESQNVLESYIHLGGKIGVLVELKTAGTVAGNLNVMAKDVAMQVAAMNPQYLKPENVPADVISHEREIISSQTKAEGKPEAAIPKIVEGRLRKFYEETCLLNQGFIKDQAKTIKDYLGSSVEVVRYTRYQLGELS